MGAAPELSSCAAPLAGFGHASCALYDRVACTLHDACLVRRRIRHRVRGPHVHGPDPSGGYLNVKVNSMVTKTGTGLPSFWPGVKRQRRAAPTA